MKIIVIIQARMGSTRLPGKVLMPLGESTVLGYVVNRCRKLNNIAQIIVATSILQQDDFIVQWCETNNVSCYRGAENDVLARYYECAKEHQPDYVIRVTSDCPFLDYELANQTIELMNKEPADIVINVQQEQLTRGLTVEMISFEALTKIYKQSTEERHREHVTFYAYEYREQFKYTCFHLPARLLQPQLRLTIDTPEDYEVCHILANQIDDSINRPSVDFVEYLQAHPNISCINSHIKQKPVI